MEFTFKNFAKAGSGTIRINDLTIICGPNNSGKTYLNYAVHSILWNFLNLFDFGLDDKEIIEQLHKLHKEPKVHLDLSRTLFVMASIKSDGFSNIGHHIHKYFRLPEDNFKNTEITLKLSELDLNKKITETGELISDMIEFHYEFVDGKCNLHLYKLDENKFKDFSFLDLLNEKNNITFIVNRIKSLLFRVHFQDIIPWPYAVTAERTGISLFYKQYDDKNSELLTRMEEMEGVEQSLNIRNMKAKLFLPIELNIRDLRNYYLSKGKSSFIVREEKNEITEQLSKLLDCGSYELKDDEIYYRPSVELSNKEPVVPIHATSSSVKSFFSLNLFIKNIAERHRMLTIDEPELNLYIDKQVMFARLVARLVNSGVKVLITTHSDYFIREINNLITMNSLRDDCKKEIMEEFDILDCDILDESRVSAYKTDTKEDIKELKTNGVGIDPRDWNKIINGENYKFNKIHFSPKKNSNSIANE